LRFLPPNVTALLQPMDQGVIEKLKKMCRNKSYIAYCYQREIMKVWLIFQRNLTSGIVATCQLMPGACQRQT
jgi:hypothetical protein